MGSRGSVIPLFIDQLKKGLPLTINGSGQQKRDFTYVGDVVRANILSSNSKKIFKGEVVNIGFGKNVSIINLAKKISKNRVFQDPLNEPEANLAGIDKARQVLNWSPETTIFEWIEKELINAK